MTRLALAAYTPYRGLRDAAGYAIAWWTDRDPDARTPPGRPRVSHVELVIDGVCHSSSLRRGGVSTAVINLNKPHWRVVPIDWRDPDEALQVYRLYEGEPYGYGDLLAQHVLRLPVDFRGPTCSELVARMLGLPRGEGLSPAWITDYCESRRTRA